MYFKLQNKVTIGRLKMIWFSVKVSSSRSPEAGVTITVHAFAPFDLSRHSAAHRHDVTAAYQHMPRGAVAARAKCSRRVSYRGSVTEVR